MVIESGSGDDVVSSPSGRGAQYFAMSPGVSSSSSQGADPGAAVPPSVAQTLIGRRGQNDVVGSDSSTVLVDDVDPGAVFQNRRSCALDDRIMDKDSDAGGFMSSSIRRTSSTSAIETERVCTCGDGKGLRLTEPPCEVCGLADGTKSLVSFQPIPEQERMLGGGRGPPRGKIKKICCRCCACCEEKDSHVGPGWRGLSVKTTNKPLHPGPVLPYTVPASSPRLGSTWQCPLEDPSL